MRVTLHPKTGINNKGLTYFCSNMRKDPAGGMLADYALSSFLTRTTATKTEELSTIAGFVQRKYLSKVTIFGKNTDGDIYALDENGDEIFRCHNNGQTAGAVRGIIIDTLEEIVYPTARYVGRTFTSTLDGDLAAAANVVNVIDAANFPTAGYAFIREIGFGSGSETIQWTGKTANQLTGVTRGKFYTTDGAHLSGREIVAFDDDWQDLGAEETTNRRPAIKFGDYNLIGNGRKLAGWKETNFSDWSASLITLPQGYEMVDFSILNYGIEPMLIIAANIEQRGMLFFCTRGDIQEGEYSKYLPVDENIKKLHKNFIGLASGIYQTDSYEIKLVAALPDDEKEIRSADFAIYDIILKGDFLLITANCGQLDRNRTGLWILDLGDRSWEYILPSNYGVYGLSFGAIFISSEWRILVSHSYNSGRIDLLATGATSRGSYYQMIYEPPISKVYKLQEIRLNLATKLKTYYNNKNFGFDIIVRYYDFKRPFLQYSLIKEVSALNQLILYDTYGKPAVGDRVEVIERRNSSYADIAGNIRNVTAIDETGGKFTLTLDENLTSTPTANTQLVLINPLKKVDKISFTGSELVLDDLDFTISNMPEFRKIMIEVEIRYSETGTSVGLISADLIFTPK